EPKPLPPPSPPAGEPGWVQLFNGTDLTGLKVDGSWKVEDHVLVSDMPESRVFPLKSFGDFHCRIELKVAAETVGALDFRAQAGLGAGVVLGKMAPPRGLGNRAT